MAYETYKDNSNDQLQLILMDLMDNMPYNACVPSLKCKREFKIELAFSADFIYFIFCFDISTHTVCFKHTSPPQCGSCLHAYHGRSPALKWPTAGKRLQSGS